MNSLTITDSKSLERTGRIAELRCVAIAITLLSLLGHFFFGFEQSPAQPLVALGAAYSMELAMELAAAWARGRKPAFFGGFRRAVDFLLAAHITGLIVAMLLYANDRLWVVAFAAGTAIGSKALLRVQVGQTTRHFLNPANCGLVVTLIVFSWTGVAPPYHFTENLGPVGNWLFPATVIVSGIFLNARFSRRIPLILSWIVCFALQALIRSLIGGAAVVAALSPATGVAFVLFTFYVMTDPATTPSTFRGQILFGIAMATAYGTLVSVHVVFGLFFGLAIVCLARGAVLFASARVEGRQPERHAAQKGVRALGMSKGA